MKIENRTKVSFQIPPNDSLLEIHVESVSRGPTFSSFFHVAKDRQLCFLSTSRWIHDFLFTQNAQVLGRSQNEVVLFRHLHFTHFLSHTFLHQFIACDQGDGTFLVGTA